MENQAFNTIRKIVKHWWLELLIGVVYVAAGACVVLSPLEFYLLFSVAFAIIILGTGIVEILVSIKNNKSTIGWGWTLAGGVLDVIIGAYLIYAPVITIGILPVIIGLWLLFRGIMTIGSALKIHQYGYTEWQWLFYTGIIIISIALIIILNPAFELNNIIFWAGLAFVFAGIFRGRIFSKFLET